MRVGKSRHTTDSVTKLEIQSQFVYLTSSAMTMKTTLTRKPRWRWQTRATGKHAENCSKSTWKQVADKWTTCLK